MKTIDKEYQTELTCLMHLVRYIKRICHLLFLPAITNPLTRFILELEIYDASMFPGMSCEMVNGEVKEATTFLLMYIEFQTRGGIYSLTLKCRKIE